MKRSLCVVIGLGACGAMVGAAAACAAVLGFSDRTESWCARRSHAFCEDFDDPSRFATNWTLPGKPQYLISTFDPASLPSAAHLIAKSPTISLGTYPIPGQGESFLTAPLDPSLFQSEGYTKVAIGFEAQLLTYDPDAQTYDGALPFAPLIFFLFVDQSMAMGETAFGGIVLEQQDAGFWAPAGVRVIYPQGYPQGDAAPDVIVSPPNYPQTVHAGFSYGQNYICSCIELTLSDGGVQTSASLGTIAPLPTFNPAAPLAAIIGLVQAPLGTEIAIDNVTVDYDVDCDNRCVR